jgi:cell division protein FtsI (penicillin-binding protein 3)
LVFLLLFSFCVSSLIYIQVFKSSYFSRIADRQHNFYMELEPLRGAIYDRNLKPLAFNLPSDSLYASPRQIKNKEKAIALLKDILGLSHNYLKNRLYRDKAFVWIARKIPPEQVDKIKKLKIAGLGFMRESKRCYPNNDFASHMIGFAGLDNAGLDGLELSLDEYLKGASGWAQVLRDAKQNALLYKNMVLPKDGYEIILTIDEFIQFVAERELDKAYRKFKAKGASVIVMDPKTGEILGFANRPSYNLNRPQDSGADSRRNRAICDMFEPGSVFKIVTASAALEEGRFSESSRFFCEEGSYRVASHILHDHHPHGWLTFAQVISESSNIGTTKIAQAIGAGLVYKYAYLFGFGKPSGVDMAGEIPGVLKEPRLWSKTSIGAIPIGQEVGVNALQLACAISAIANGGVLMNPFVVKAIRQREGEIIREFSPREIRRVVSRRTAMRMKDILVLATEEGTGRLARVADFKVAGKTGTAQKIEPNGAYSHSKYTASFIGFAPSDEPLIAVVVTVDEPHPYYFGGVVSAPVFKQISQDVVKYLKLQKDAYAVSEIVKAAQ